MLTDRIPLADLDAYLIKGNDPKPLNLAGEVPGVVRTPLPVKGVQREVNAIDFLIEGDDLDGLMTISDLDVNQIVPPLIELRVVKEVFPGLFVDPFSHRAHTLTGYQDLKKGEAKGCRAMEIEGVPTLVSMGAGECEWTSHIYTFPRPVMLLGAGWELASSLRAPQDSFDYSLSLKTWSGSSPFESAGNEVPLVIDAYADAQRYAPDFSANGVRHIQVGFKANVRQDPYLHERHESLLGESIGRPLLQSVSLLEPVRSAYSFRTLHELLIASSSYELFGAPGQPLRCMSVRLDISAVLVHSERQNPDPDQENERYEFLELRLGRGGFSRFEARLDATEAVQVEYAKK